MNGKNALLYVLINLILLSCGGKGTITEVSNLSRSSEISASITAVEISNNQLVLSGSGFGNVTNVRITGPSSFDESLTIESKSNTSLTANGNQAISFSIDSIFNIVLSNAYASASYSIIFTLQDGIVEARHLDDMSANDGDVIVWNDISSIWEPASLNGLNYKGTWDASDISDPPTDDVGDYYYISVSGNHNLDGITDWTQGDWAISTGTLWQKIDNSTLVPSVFGRNGDILPQTNDYTWEQIDKSSSTLGGIADVLISSTPADEEVLAWDTDTSKWVPMAISLSSNSVTSFELSNSSVNSDKIVNYSITASDIATNAISYSRLNIGVGDLSINQIDSLDASLDAKLPLVGGTMSGDINMNNNNINTVGTVDGVDVFALNATVASNLTDIATLDASKQGNITSLTDLTVKSLTTATQAAIILEPYGSSASQTAEIHFKELAGNEDNYIGFRAPNLIDTNLIWTLPATDGANAQVLQTDGFGNLSWTDGGGVEDSIDSSSIQDNAITSTEIATSAVSTTEILDNSITVDDLEFASSSGIDIPQLSTDPATVSATAGQTYYNTTSNNIMYFNETSWVEVGSGSGNNYSLDAADGSPTSVVYVDNDGNVGIGTTAPAAKLEISGDIRVTGICDETGNNCKDISSGWTSGSASSGAVLLDTITVSASTPSATFTDLSQNYDRLIVQGHNFTCSGSGVDFDMKVSTDNGSTWETSLAYACTNDEGGSDSAGGAAGINFIRWAGHTDSAENYDGVLTINNYTAGIYPTVFGVSHKTNDTANEVRFVAGIASTTSGINAVQFVCNSSNVENGTFKVYGISSDGGGSSGTGHSLDAEDGSPASAVYVDNDGNVGIGTTTPAATLDVNGTISVLGAWDDAKTFDTSYQAPSDGLVVAIAHSSSGSDYSCYLTGYTDSSNPPTTVRGRATARRHSSIHYVQGTSFTMPVRKGEYWKVERSVSGSTEESLQWIPLGK